MLRVRMLYRLLSTIFLVIFSSSSFAADVIVYRWVDENNIVHYSQQQPEHDNYTELTINKDHKTKEQEKRAQAPVDPEPTEAEISASAEKCELASKNLSTLLEFKNIQYESPDGEIKTLSVKEKEQQLALSKKEVEIYCPK